MKFFIFFAPIHFLSRLYEKEDLEGIKYQVRKYVVFGGFLDLMTVACPQNTLNWYYPKRK